MIFENVAASSETVNVADLLIEISNMTKCFIVCSEENYPAIALWVAMTWVIDVIQVAPLAVISAPEKRCGKSQLLALLNKLVYKPLLASNITPAALFRSIDEWKPTLLIDETDSFMRENEELRGLLNAGHTRDAAYVIKVVGKEHTPKKFNVWGAKALAGIGHLPDTVMDRAIVFELRRKLPHEKSERLRNADPKIFDALKAKLARFSQDYQKALQDTHPTLPDCLHDRAQDNWEPLLAIADIAGGIWPNLARSTAIRLSKVENEPQSIGIQLLTDIQEIFELKQVTRISTANLIDILCADDEKCWATYNRGKPISPRQIATRLAEYGIWSKTIRIGDYTPKGFEISQFDEAFSRYLTSSENIRHTPQSAADVDSHVSDNPQHCENENNSETLKHLSGKGCGGVAASEQIIEVEI